MQLTINGEIRNFGQPLSADDLLSLLEVNSRHVALEVNLEIVPKSSYAEMMLSDGDKIEIVHFIGGGVDSSATIENSCEDPLIIAGQEFSSRLIVGTGKYRDFSQTHDALVASGAEIITVAVRRVNISEKDKPMLSEYIDPSVYTYLPNTAGCFNAEDALRTLRLAREVGDWKLVKLEVLGDTKTLYPDMPETLRAAEVLIKEGFDVMVYCSDDPLYAKRLEELGCAAIMPLAAPIGSGLGIQNPTNIRYIVEQSNTPVIVDAGVGTASDAAIAMELGCDGVLMNTAIAEATNPVRMARAMKLAVEAGREAYLAGRMTRRFLANPSSPTTGLV